MVPLLALLAAASRSAPAPTGLHVNHEPKEALAVPADDVVLGWAVPAAGGAQASFRVRLTAGSGALLGEFACAPSPRINCSRSDGISLRSLTAQHPSFALPAGATVGVAVQLVDSAGAQGGWSAPFYFATALAEGAWPGGAVPVWAKNATQNLVLLRRSFVADAGREHLLHITAHAVPNRMPGGGANATKLLCSYKLWLNGEPLAVGPGRPTGEGSTIQDPAQLYDTLNITALLRHGQENVIAVQSFYWNNAQERAEVPSAFQVEGDEGDLGGVLVLVRSGSTVVAASGDDGWLAFDRGDSALLRAARPPGCENFCRNNPNPSCNFCTIVGGRYHLMHEHWNMAVMPTGWQLPAYVPKHSDWSPPVQRAKPFSRLGPKGARAIALVAHAPSIRAVTPSGAGDFKCASGGGFCYIVDMNREIQGGLNITFERGTTGQQLTVRASETLLPSGAVQFNGSDDSVHWDVWTLAAGRQTVVTHEYIEAR